MRDTLRGHLEHRLGAGFRRMMEAIEGLDEAEATAGARADWRRYRWGVGLDGSVAGIVRHVAAWKQICATGLETGDYPDEEAVAPPAPGWTALREWLVDGQRRLEALLARLADADLGQTMPFAGESASIGMIFTHLLEHDFYHAGQINLLRQQRGHDLSATAANLRR
jgi:uncharacterized damage-inducible protein DinB